MKIVITGLLFIIVGILAYFVFVYIPHKDQLQQQQLALANKEKEAINNLNLQQKCKDAGEKAYNQTYERSNVPGVLYVSDPEYVYSKKTNQCLYSYMLSTKIPDNAPKDSGIPWVRYVKDSLTNQTVTSYQHNVFDNSDKANKAMMDWYKKRDELMNVQY